MAGQTPQDFWRQLEVTRQLNPRVQFPVSHISISFAPEERPGTEQLEQIVKATLVGMRFDKCLHFAATHDDRDHFHLHIANPSVVEQLQDAIDATIQPGMSITQLFEQLAVAGAETRVKVTDVGIVRGISYSFNGNGVAFPGSKLGRNNNSCTFQGLGRRGVTFDLGRDAEAIATRAASNSQGGASTPAASLIPLIQSHSKNLFLTVPTSMSETLGGDGSENNDSEQDLTIAANDDKGDVLVELPPASRVVPNINPIQRQLAQTILPHAQRAFRYSLEHSPHQVGQEDGLTKVEGQDYCLTRQQVEGNTIFSVTALDEREEILHTRNGRLEMFSGVTTADREKWQAIGAKLERLEKQSEKQNGQKTQNGQDAQKQPERQIVL